MIAQRMPTSYMIENVEDYKEMAAVQTLLNSI